MIKNTSGLAVQPCRLHERFYYHARLLYYILRQKARGFFARGQGAPAPPFFLSASPEGFCGGGGPSTSRCRRSALHPGEFFAGRQSQPLPMQALRPAPGGVFCGTAVPAPNDARGSPSALPRAGAPHEHGFAMLGAPGDFLMRRKSPKTHQEPPGSWTSGTRGRTPLDSPAPCPSGIGCGSIEPAASSGAILPSHGLKTQSVPSMKPKEKNKTGLSTSSKWQIGLGLWQKVARRETERSAASAKRAAATHRGIPKGAALGAPLVTFPATGKSPGVGGAERPPL